MGEDAGFGSRYYHKGGLGWYTFLTCGGCMATAQPCNLREARQNGWAKRPVWGWLCCDCLVRLRFLAGPVLPENFYFSSY
jgi:hypothetical protein